MLEIVTWKGSVSAEVISKLLVRGWEMFERRMQDDNKRVRPLGMAGMQRRRIINKGVTTDLSVFREAAAMDLYA
jgi:hypothetical protein